MKNSLKSIKIKLTLVCAILVTLGFSTMVFFSVKFIDKRVTQSMISHFINENKQMANQATIILENGGGIKELQSFVSKKTSENTYIAYAIVIDKTVTAVAHSDTPKIGKNYSDDTSYTVPASQKGEIKTSRFWADVQKSWTYDIMCPIYVHGTLYGSMDVGIYDSTVDKTVQSIRLIQILIAVIMIIIISILIFLFTILQLKPLSLLVEKINEIATGHADLTNRIKVTSNDEIGDVIVGFNSFIEKLQTIVRDIKQSKEILEEIGLNLHACSADTSSSLTEIASNIESVNKQILNQSESINQTSETVDQSAQNLSAFEKMISLQSTVVMESSSAVEQMIGNINSVTHSVEVMAQSFKSLEEIIGSGTKKQTDANEKIQQIEEESQMLQEANKVIASIASQTNLLAMNAAIEAAHAGDAGRGFSVVADEIRKLSETSATQSRRIGDQLQKIQESIKNVVSSSDDAIHTFNSVTQQVSQTSMQVNQITSAMEEQSLGSKQILDSLQSMDGSSKDVQKASHEMTNDNNMILSEVEKLQGLANMMKDSVTEMNLGTKTINKTTSSLLDISSNMKTAISQIGNQIDKFKV